MSSRDRILDAAEHEWQQNNAYAPSIRAIAQRSNLNVALISYYFNNANGLNEAMIARVAKRVRHKLPDSTANSGKNIEQLFKIVDLWLRMLIDDRAIRIFIYGSPFLGHPRVTAARSYAENLIRRRAAEALQEVPTSNVTPEEIVDVVIGPPLYALASWGDAIDFESLRARTYNHLMRLGLNYEQRSVASPPAPPPTLVDSPKPKPKPKRKPKEPNHLPVRRSSDLDFID